MDDNYTPRFGAGGYRGIGPVTELKPGQKVSETVAIDRARALLQSLPGFAAAPKDHTGETPKRFYRMLKDMTTPTDYDVRFKVFPAQSQDMITVGPIPFYTLCAHHVVPFFGSAWVSYVPDNKIAGLSKFARVVKGIAKGLWVQEELTEAIVDYLDHKLEPLGVGIIMKAEHLCMAMRGIETAHVITTTSAMRGVYSDHARTAKAEFFAIVNR